MVVKNTKHAEITFNNIFNKLCSCVYLVMCLWQWHLSVTTFSNTSVLWKGLFIFSLQDCTVMFSQVSLMQHPSPRQHPSCFPPHGSHHFSLCCCLSAGPSQACDLFLFPWLPPFLSPNPPSPIQGPLKPSSAPHPGLNSLGNGWPNGALTCC